MRRRYPTDLTDAEWECIEPHLTSPNKRGRPKIHSHSLRRVLDAVILRLEEWLRLAIFAPRVPALEGRLLLVQEMAHRGHLRAVKRGVAQAVANPLRQTHSAHGGYRRLPVGQDKRGRW